MPSRNAGFTLIETAVSSAVLIIFFASVASIFNISLSTLAATRVKKVAELIALEQLEVIHNIDYEDLGTVGGIPAGVVEPEEIRVIDNQEFTINTDILFVDDPFDDVAPTDDTPTDYKRIRVNVSWNTPQNSINQVTMLTDIAPDFIESADGGGTLEITVFDANGNVVPNADVSIVASSTVPPVNINTVTNNEGVLSIPGTPACSSCYEITVTKSGYTTDRTYSTAEVANPAKPHATVLAGAVTPTSFAIDNPSSVNFRAVRSAAFSYAPFSNARFRVYGTKEIGTTALDEPVYLYDQEIVTGTGGLKTVTGLVWDTYRVEIPTGSSIDMAGSWPYNPFSLLPGTTGSFSFVVVGQSDPTLLVTLLDNANSAIASASIELKNSSVSYIATQSTNPIGVIDQSQSYFSGIPSTIEPYDITIDAPGFNSIQTQATISGDTVEAFTLTPE